MRAILGTMEVSERESSIVPESAMDPVNRTLINVEEVGAILPDFLSLSDPEVLSQMQPLQRAQSLLLLAKITSTLFACKNFLLFFAHSVCIYAQRLIYLFIFV